jgi:crotonobetainyl-CoA:carnitine CoA-transferase CaiB-like acyl-CoA transferase
VDDVADDMSGGPLQGLRVVEAATLAAGPMVGTALGELGAEVIKVEQPGAGDPTRWGLDYESVHDAHPEIVMLHVSD